LLLFKLFIDRTVQHITWAINQDMFVRFEVSLVHRTHVHQLQIQLMACF
jgi:hypothetical protein